MSQLEPVISVIVAVYNNAEQIQRCIDSFYNQTYAYKEIIVMDGGSNDGTVEIIKFNVDKLAYWESQKDKGIYHAWNKALNKVTGDWVIFLGSDDYFYSNNAFTLIAPHLGNTEDSSNVVYGKLKVVRSDGKEIDEVGKPWSRQRFLELAENLPHISVFHRRSLFEKNGQFDESFRISGDYELLLRELKERDPVFVESITVSVMESGGVSSNDFNAVNVVKECIKAREKNGLSSLSVGLVWLYFKFSVKILLYKSIGDDITKKFIDGFRLITGRSHEK